MMQDQSKAPNYTTLRGHEWILASCLTWGTTSVRMGIGGRYRATMLAVEPDCVYTTMREAPTLSAARTADDAMAYQRQ